VPAATYPPLIFNPDRGLTGPVAGQLFQPVARRAAQISEVLGRGHHHQLFLGLPREGPKASVGDVFGVELVGPLAGEGFYHG